MVDLKKIDALTKEAVDRCCKRLEEAKKIVKKGNGKGNGATLPSFKSKYL